MKQSKGKNRKEIQQWILFRLAERLEISVDAIDVNASFNEYGLDSAEAVELTGGLSEWLGEELSPTLVWEYPNVQELVDYLSSQHAEDASIETSVEKPKPTWNEPIAVIGMGCRFPGASNIKEYWELLCKGKVAIGELSEERQAGNSSGEGWTRGGYLKEIDGVDLQFFGFSPREAEKIDPQQRFLMEVTWEALEMAGLSFEEVEGSKTGVFIGISSNDYGRLFLDDRGESDIYAVTGNAFSIAANRISHWFNLRGPSLAVDTACSSSLTALHWACRSIQYGECEMAIVGGSNLLLSQEISLAFSQAGMLSKDGQCRTFDASANGYVRGEGAGAVILKPLSAALKEDAPILAVIKGSAMNHNGKSNGLTAPSLKAQVELLREAYQNAGISPAKLQYVEAHGTGTVLGDPIEVQALGRVLEENQPESGVCTIGSVKSNIGHLEAAAGIAGFIKTVLALHYRQLPPSAHFREPNPYIPFDRIPIRVQTTLSWPDESKRLFAGVSSFGFGGANVHVVLEEAPFESQHQPVVPKQKEEGMYLLPFSARSVVSLQQWGRHLQQELDQTLAEERLEDICYTTQSRRTHHPYRLAVVAETKEELKEALEGCISQDAVLRTRKGSIVPAFVFNGQGTHHWGMGRELYQKSSVFRDVIETCDQYFQPFSGWSLIEEMFASQEKSRLDRTEVAQPLIFAIQVALARWWMSVGVTPKAILGHSLGEVAAYHIAGSLLLEEALYLVYQRSRLMEPLAGRGKMAAVNLPFEAALKWIAPYGSRLSIAADNSPRAVTIAGDPGALNEVVQALEKERISARWLPVNYAFHSSQMEDICPELVESLEPLQYGREEIPVFSTVTGKQFNNEALSSSYWAQNARETVRFREAIQQCHHFGCNTFLEIGTDQVLTRYILESTDSKSGVVSLASMRKGKKESRVLMESLAHLYQQGLNPRWEAVTEKKGRTVFLPPYAWDRQSCLLKRGTNHKDQPAMIRSQAAAAKVEHASSIGDEIKQAESGQRYNRMVDYLRQRVAEVLQMSPEKIEVTQPLTTLGIDSIMALELKNRVEMELNIRRVSLVRFLAGPTLENIARELLTHLLDEEEGQDPLDEFVDEQERIEQILNDLDHLSDEEIDHLLAEFTTSKEE